MEMRVMEALLGFHVDIWDYATFAAISALGCADRKCQREALTFEPALVRD
jgi:hypothetical protein